MVLVIIGSDHGGFEHKQAVITHLENSGVEVLDMGTDSDKSVDYPDYAKIVCRQVLDKNAVGILICGTGIGMSISANKIKGIRAALCHNDYTAQKAREHNNANVLCMGGRVITKETALNLVDIFLSTDFSSEERHHRRVDKMMTC